MPRYFFEIAFDGTQYSGWQRQKSVVTLQQTIEDKLAILLQKEVRIHGCGRTDAGVHASQFYFHIDLKKDPQNILYQVNKMLPPDIVFLSFHQVAGQANAQKDATKRTYEYLIAHQKNPFSNPYAAEVIESIDIELLKQALISISGRHDFRNFCKRPDTMAHTVCTIFNVNIDHDHLKRQTLISVTGNRFVHHMMRLLIGNAIKVGKGILPMEEFQDYLHLKAKPLFFELAPAQGLTLKSVEY